MRVRHPLAAIAVAALALTACGGDDDSGATAIDEPDTAEETDVVVTADGGATEEPEVPVDEPEVPIAGPDGTGTFSAGDVTIEGDIVACTLQGGDVSLNLNGENGGVEVVSTGGGTVSVMVSGMVEWVGSGQSTVSGSSVTITGTGSAPDPSAAVEDFTLSAEINGC